MCCRMWWAGQCTSIVRDRVGVGKTGNYLCRLGSYMWGCIWIGQVRYDRGVKLGGVECGMYSLWALGTGNTKSAGNMDKEGWTVGQWVIHILMN